MPITIKRIIRIRITNSFNNNKTVKDDKETEKKLNQAHRVTIRTKAITQKYLKEN